MTAGIPLGALRPDPWVESDLRWLFTEASGELGLRSSYGAMVAVLQGGGGGDAEAATVAEERRVEASVRARKIEAVLHRIPRRLQAALRAYYGPPKVRGAWWGRYGDVVLLTAVYRREYGAGRRAAEKLALRMVTGLATAQERELAHALKRGAEALVAEAHRAYAEGVCR